MTLPSYIYWSLAVVLLIVFSLSKFYSESTDDPTKLQNRVLAQVLSRDRVFAEKFLSYALVYVLVMIVVFLAVVFVGHQVGLADAFKDKEYAWPFFSALIVIGLASPVPWLSKLELIVRTNLQHLALIKTDVEVIAIDLKTLKYVPDHLTDRQRTEIFRPMSVEKLYIKGDLTDATLQWIRSSILIFSIRGALQNEDIMESIGREFIAKYEPLLASIESDRRSINDQLDLGATADQEEYERKLYRAHVAIEKLNDDVRNFAACALVRRPEQIELPRALKVLGIEPSDTQIAQMRYAREISTKLEILIYGFFLAGIASIFIYAVLHLISDEFITRLPPSWVVQWPSRTSMGTNLYAHFMDLFWFGLILWLAFSFRARKIRDGEWFAPDPVFHRMEFPKASAYLSIGIKLFLIAAVSLFLIGGMILLTVDGRCASSDATYSTCMVLMTDYAERYIPKELLKLFSIMVATTVFLILTEKIVMRGPLLGIVLKSIVGMAVTSFFFAVYAINNESSIPYGYNHVESSPLRTGFLGTSISAITIFWFVFVFYSVMQQRRAIARVKVPFRSLGSGTSKTRVPATNVPVP